MKETITKILLAASGLWLGYQIGGIVNSNLNLIPPAHSTTYVGPMLSNSKVGVTVDGFLPRDVYALLYMSKCTTLDAANAAAAYDFANTVMNMRKQK